MEVLNWTETEGTSRFIARTRDAHILDRVEKWLVVGQITTFVPVAILHFQAVLHQFLLHCLKWPDHELFLVSISIDRDEQLEVYEVPLVLQIPIFDLLGVLLQLLLPPIED